MFDIRSARLPRVRRCAPLVVCRAALRWGCTATAVIALGACTARRLAPPDPKVQATVKVVAQTDVRLDVLFAIDNSTSMAPLVESMNRNFPAFMDELRRLPNGIPDLHVAVVSSDLGAEESDRCKFDGDGGQFQSAPRPATGVATCPVPRQSFITATADGTGNNFDGDIRDVFACIANLTENGSRIGCGFEHQLESVRRALGGTPGIEAPSINAGFLRPNVPLAVIWLTNEDDCSVPLGSSFLASNNMDAQGSLTEFRCNEFGHSCNGQKLDRNSDASGLDCHDAGDAPWQRLVPVSEYVRFFEQLKPAGQFVPVVIAAPPSPYVVAPRLDKRDAFTGATAHGVAASCGTRMGATSGSPVYGDPAVRMFDFARAFGAVLGDEVTVPDICEPDYSKVMGDVGKKLAGVLEACVQGQVVDGDPERPGDQPDCVVADREQTDDGRQLERPGIPPCVDGGGIPAGAEACWQLVSSPSCPAGKKVDIRRAPGSGRGRVALVSCALQL